MKALDKLAAACERYTPWTAIDPLGGGLLTDMSGSGGLWLDVTGCAHLYAGVGAGENQSEEFLEALKDPPHPYLPPPNKLGREGAIVATHSIQSPPSLRGRVRVGGALTNSTENTGVNKGEEALVKDLRDRCLEAGYQPRIGLADTPGAAWAAARFGDTPYTIIPQKAHQYSLAALPIAGLRLDTATLEGLESLGLRHIGDLYEMPRAPLASRFGGQALRRLDQLLGRLEEPISPRRPAPSHFARLVFAEPIGRSEDISLALDKLLAELCEDLEETTLGARRLELIIFRVDNTRDSLVIGTSQPSRDADHLARLFRDDLDTLDPGFGIEVIVLAASETNALAARQIDIAGKTAQQANENAAKLVDRLSGRLGSHNVIRLHPVESHLPECASETRPALKASVTDEKNWQGPLRRPPRPLQLLTQPLPIDVMAPVPDGPPVMFRWRKQQHKITRAEGPERISPEWWRPTQLQTRSRSLTKETRDYYRLEDQNGNRYWVYREGLYRPDKPPGWYLHGFFA
ncbi:MAG: DNA polymerase Y family protein [Rhodospirillaceae bacterium]|nr:DNA polymerase Y family protein [Rhodospirillaceae bacterium]